MTHSVPTRRASDLRLARQGPGGGEGDPGAGPQGRGDQGRQRSEEHTSEIQSLMRISYAVFCSKKNKQQRPTEMLMPSIKNISDTTRHVRRTYDRLCLKKNKEKNIRLTNMQN